MVHALASLAFPLLDLARREAHVLPEGSARDLLPATVQHVTVDDRRSISLFDQFGVDLNPLGVHLAVTGVCCQSERRSYECDDGDQPPHARPARSETACCADGRSNVHVTVRLSTRPARAEPRKWGTRQNS